MRPASVTAEGREPKWVSTRRSRATQIGPYVSTRYSWGTAETTLGQGFIVDKLDTSGKIAHEWVIVGAP